MTAAIAAMESGATRFWSASNLPGSSGNIVMARAGDSANFAPDDSAALFLEDTLEGGARLNHPDVAHTMCADSAARIRDLYDWGIPFITREDGSFDLHPQGGHKRDRGIYPLRTGAWRWRGRCARNGRRRRPYSRNVMAVICSWMRGCCRGVVGFHTRSGEIYAIRAAATILATGGAGQIFSENTNAGGITGDGFGVALRAGLALSDMEFVQFYPAVIKRPESNMVVAPTLFPLGARFLNRGGADIMRDVPGGGDATRDLMARAVYLELMRGGGVDGAVQMDLSGISMADLEHFAPDNLKLFARRGVSPHGGDIYVSPKAHFFMGGVPIDGEGATAMGGLYAAGEVSAGAHGANRLSNNAFTEAHTLGWRAGKAASGYARSSECCGSGPCAREAPRGCARSARGQAESRGGLGPRTQEALLGEGGHRARTSLARGGEGRARRDTGRSGFLRGERARTAGGGRRGGEHVLERAGGRGGRAHADGEPGRALPDRLPRA